jgi:hypothetical protein
MRCVGADGLGKENVVVLSRRSERQTASRSRNGIAFIACMGSMVAVLVATTAQATSEAARPRRSAVTAKLVLNSTHVHPGGTVSGKLVVENRTAKRRALLRGCRTDGFFAVALRASAATASSRRSSRSVAGPSRRSPGEFQVPKSSVSEALQRPSCADASASTRMVHSAVFPRRPLERPGGDVRQARH